jgi:hypothetical protein
MLPAVVHVGQVLITRCIEYISLTMHLVKGTTPLWSRILIALFFNFLHTLETEKCGRIIEKYTHN